DLAHVGAEVHPAGDAREDGEEEEDLVDEALEEPIEPEEDRDDEDEDIEDVHRALGLATTVGQGRKERSGAPRRRLARWRLRELEPEEGALPDARPHPDRAAVPFRHALHGGEPEADPGLERSLPADVWLEHV